MKHTIKIIVIMTMWFAALLYTSHKDNEQREQDQLKHCKRLQQDVGPLYKQDKLCAGVKL